jgi:hypothetical protein
MRLCVQVKLNIYKDVVITFYSGSHELVPDSNRFTFTHCGFVRTLATGLASTSQEAVSCCQRLMKLSSKCAAPGKSKQLVRDVVSDVTTSLTMLSPTMMASNESEWWEGDGASVMTSSTSPIDHESVAVYRKGSSVQSESSWGDVFGFVWGLWLPLMSGCKLTCGAQHASVTCDVLISSTLPCDPSASRQVCSLRQVLFGFCTESRLFVNLPFAAYRSSVCLAGCSTSHAQSHHNCCVE